MLSLKGRYWFLHLRRIRTQIQVSKCESEKSANCTYILHLTWWDQSSSEKWKVEICTDQVPQATDSEMKTGAQEVYRSVFLASKHMVEVQEVQLSRRRTDQHAVTTKALSDPRGALELGWFSWLFKIGKGRAFVPLHLSVPGCGIQCGIILFSHQMRQGGSICAQFLELS